MNIVKDGLHCYVVHSFNKNPYYLSTEYPMIRHNEILSLLPVQVMDQNGEKLARFDITGYCSLMDWGEKRKIGYEEFQMILQSIADLFRDLEEYMLSLNQICFQPDQIFIDSQEEVRWIYLPEDKEDMLHEVNSLFLWILSFADYKDRQAMDLIYHVFDGVKRKEFSREFVETCLLSVKEDSQNDSLSIPEIPMIESKSEETDNSDVREEPSVKKKSLAVATLVKGIVAGALMIFDIILIICGIQFVMEEGMSSRMIIIFGVAFAIFIFSAWTLLKIFPMERLVKRGMGKEKHSVKEEVVKKTPTRIVCSDFTGQCIPILLDQDTGEEIELEVLPFYIGTKDGLNHLNVDSQGVSRQHAVITKTEDGEHYQIEDLDSKTGTKVDGRRIPSAYPVILQEGCHIELGRSKWEFHVSRS